MSDAFFRQTELDAASWPELREQVMHFTHDEPLGEPRTYPGYPRWPLDRVRPRLWPALDRVLVTRRSASRLDDRLPTRKTLSRLLFFSHGVHATRFRGPTPSSGGLQSLELYCVNFVRGWLPPGSYHYDRVGHHLSQIAAEADRGSWRTIAPSLDLVEGGAIVWVLVGDGARLEQKYGRRGDRFLLLEAGHLMQSLCLMSTSLGLATVPLGGFFEREIARLFRLLDDDRVLYLGVAGRLSN
jgi:SagB-type dehydrogenase family enzyme